MVLYKLRRGIVRLVAKILCVHFTTLATHKPLYQWFDDEAPERFASERFAR